MERHTGVPGQQGLDAGTGIVILPLEGEHGLLRTRQLEQRLHTVQQGLRVDRGQLLIDLEQGLAFRPVQDDVFAGAGELEDRKSTV